MSIAALGTLLIGLTASAQTPTADSPSNSNPPPHAKHTVAEQRGDKSAVKADSSAPSAELLDYLGSYQEAADGLDPLGLAGEDTLDNKKAATDKQGSGP